MTVTTMSIRPEVFSTVQRCISQSLALPVEDIGLSSRLIDELGADSLDFVDIVFMLEREMGIKVRETEFNALTRLDYSSPAVMREGVLTKEVVEQLRTWLPAVATVPDPARITPRMMFSLITVESMCIVAQRRVDAERGAAR
jgi:acyl carrier protein